MVRRCWRSQLIVWRAACRLVSDWLVWFQLVFALSEVFTYDRNVHSDGHRLTIFALPLPFNSTKTLDGEDEEEEERGVEE